MKEEGRVIKTSGIKVCREAVVPQQLCDFYFFSSTDINRI